MQEFRLLLYKEEQIMRARALARISLIQMVEPEHLHPASLSQKIREVLKSRDKRPRVSVDVHGLNTAVREIIETAFSGR